MKDNVDYYLLVQAERIRFQSDFSAAHWLFQVIEMYGEGISVKARRDAFEHVIRIAVRSGVAAALAAARSYPSAACFPDYVANLNAGDKWDDTCRWVLTHFDEHTRNRFEYAREGD